MPNPILAVAGAKAAGSAITGSKAAKAAKKAAAAEVAAQEKALALQKEMFDRQVALQEPFRQAGLLSQNELMRQMGLAGDASSAGYGGLLKAFGQEDFQQDPGYAFRMSEGLKALDRQAAARGGLISGAALKASQRYGQDLASQEYQNAYQRYMANKAFNLNALTGQQGVGAEAVNTLGGAARNYATQGGQNIIGAGQARASGYRDVAAAKNAMLGGLFNVASDLAGGYGSTWGAGSSTAPTSNPWQNPNSMLKRVTG